LIASAEAQQLTNNRLVLTIAANYGGRWDIQQAFGGWLKVRSAAGISTTEPVNPEDIDLTPFLSMAYAPDPDLIIRTGASNAPAISCCGRGPMPNCILPTHFGPPLIPRNGAGARLVCIAGTTLWPDQQAGTSQRELMSVCIE